VSASNRRIDHLVLAVHELDRAAARYARPGFIVGARNRNPWGTENRVIQLRSSFLELIAVADADLIPPPAAPLRLRRFVRDELPEVAFFTFQQHFPKQSGVRTCNSTRTARRTSSTSHSR